MMQFEQPSIFIQNIRIEEPVTTLTDLFVLHEYIFNSLISIVENPCYIHFFFVNFSAWMPHRC